VGYILVPVPLQSTAVPMPANWQSHVNPSLANTSVQVAVPPPGAGTLIGDVPDASIELVMKPLPGLQLQVSEQELWTTVQLVLAGMPFAQADDEPAVSSVTV
jgi:hypothetical protein